MCGGILNAAPRPYLSDFLPCNVNHDDFNCGERGWKTVPDSRHVICYNLAANSFNRRSVCLDLAMAGRRKHEGNHRAYSQGDAAVSLQRISNSKRG